MPPPNPGSANPLSWYSWQGHTLRLALRVQPRARENAFGEPLGDELRMRIKAPPVDGKANAALVAFLAKAFGVPKGRVRVVLGEHGRSKLVAIEAPQMLPEAMAHSRGQ